MNMKYEYRYNELTICGNGYYNLYNNTINYSIKYSRHFLCFDSNYNFMPILENKTLG